MNVRETHNNKNKNVSRKRFITIVESNEDLRTLVNIISTKEGLTQKQFISKLILEYAIKLTPKFEDLKEILLFLEESTNLLKKDLITSKNYKLTEEEQVKLKKFLVSIYNELKDKDRETVHDTIDMFEKVVKKTKKAYGITAEMLDYL